MYLSNPLHYTSLFSLFDGVSLSTPPPPPPNLSLSLSLSPCSYISVSLSLSTSLSHSVCLSICLSVCLSLSFCRSLTFSQRIHVYSCAQVVIITLPMLLTNGPSFSCFQNFTLTNIIFSSSIRDVLQCNTKIVFFQLT